MIDVLALHRDLVATPSVSGNEEAIASFVGTAANQLLERLSDLRPLT